VAEGGKKRMEEVGKDAGFKVVSDGEGTKDVVGEGSSRASTRGMKIHEGKWTSRPTLCQEKGETSLKTMRRVLLKTLQSFTTLQI